MYQLINEFTISIAAAAVMGAIQKLNNEKKEVHETTTTKKHEPKKVEKKKTTKKEAVKIKPRSFEQEFFNEDVNDEEEDVDPFEYDFRGDDEDSEMITHLETFLGLMNLIDDCLDVAVKEDKEAEPVYEKFGKFYHVMIPYSELVNVTYQMHFTEELERSVDRLSRLTDKFVHEFIDELSDDTHLGSSLLEEIKEITKLARIRIESGNGRPTFDSIITINDESTSDEIKAE